MQQQTPPDISPPNVLDYGQLAPAREYRPRAWNSVVLGAIALFLVGAVPFLGWLLTGKGQGAGFIFGCMFFPLLFGVMVAGVGSAIRSLLEGPARLVAIIGLFLNLAPIWVLPLLARLKI